MIKVHHTNARVDEQISKLGSQVALIDEKDNREARIVEAIRTRYTLSEELALHRKKEMGTIDPDEWSAYCDFVESVIAQNKA